MNKRDDTKRRSLIEQITLPTYLNKINMFAHKESIYIINSQKNIRVGMGIFPPAAFMNAWIAMAVQSKLNVQDQNTTVGFISVLNYRK